MNKKKIMSVIKALAEGVKGNARLIKENQQAISKLTERFEALSEHSDYLDRLTTELSHALPDPEYDARCKAAAADVSESLVKHGARLGLTKQAPLCGSELTNNDLKPGDVLLREDWHDYFEEGARYIVTDDLQIKDLQGDEWPFLRKSKDLYVFGLDDAATACFVKAEDVVHG